MGPRDRHSILRFIAFCQNNILCAAIFSESELGADVAPEQFHMGEGRQEAQNKDGCFRRYGWPGKKSRGPVPCPLRWHLLPLLFPYGSAFAGFTFKGRHRTEAGWGASSSGASLQPGKDPVAWRGFRGRPTQGRQVPATWLGPVSPSSVPTQGPRVFPKAWCPPAAASPGRQGGPGCTERRARAGSGPRARARWPSVPPALSDGLLSPSAKM